jgi:molecular chaperone DnaJ
MPKYLSSNQRTILEMLADELGDTTAKRMVITGKAKSGHDPAEISRENLRMAGSHKSEGFLKSAWHKLTQL